MNSAAKPSASAVSRHLRKPLGYICAELPGKTTREPARMDAVAACNQPAISQSQPDTPGSTTVKRQYDHIAEAK